MKDGKAVEVDEIPAKMLKNLLEKAMQKVCEICQDIYEKGKWPDDFTRIARIPLPKKNNATKCSDFRTISSFVMRQNCVKNLNKENSSKSKTFDRTKSVRV